MSGQSGSTSTNNVSQTSARTFAAPLPLPQRDGEHGAPAPNVIIIDLDETDEHDRVLLTRIKQKRELDSEFQRQLKELLDQKRDLEKHDSATWDYNEKARELLSQNFESIKKLPVENMVNFCDKIVAQAVKHLVEKTPLFLEHAGIDHTELSSAEIRKFGLLTLELAVNRQLKVEEKEEQIKKLDAQIVDLRTTHNDKLSKLRGDERPIGMQRSTTEARAQVMAKDLAERQARASWITLKQQGVPEENLRIVFPQFYEDEAAAVRDLRDMDQEGAEANKAASKTADKAAATPAAGPAAAPKPSAAGPAAAPKPSAAGPAAAPRPSAAGPAAAPRPSAAGPAAASKPSAAGPAAAPKPSAAGPAAAATEHAQLSKKTSNATRQEIIETRLKNFIAQNIEIQVSSEAETSEGADDDSEHVGQKRAPDPSVSEATSAKKPKTTSTPKERIDQGKELIRKLLDEGKKDETIRSRISTNYSDDQDVCRVLLRVIQPLRNKMAARPAAPAAAPATAPAPRLAAPAAAPAPRLAAPAATEDARPAASAAAPADSRPPKTSLPLPSFTRKNGTLTRDSEVVIPSPAATVTAPAGDSEKQFKDANGVLITDGNVLNVMEYVSDSKNLVNVSESDLIDDEDKIIIPKRWEERVRDMRKAVQNYFRGGFQEEYDRLKATGYLATKAGVQKMKRLLNCFYVSYGLPTGWKTFVTLVKEGKVNQRAGANTEWLSSVDIDTFLQPFNRNGGHETAMKYSLNQVRTSLSDELAKKAPAGAPPPA